MAEHQLCLRATTAVHIEESPRVASSPTFQPNTLWCARRFYWPQFKFGNTPLAELILWKTRSHWLL